MSRFIFRLAVGFTFGNGRSTGLLRRRKKRWRRSRTLGREKGMAHKRNSKHCPEHGPMLAKETQYGWLYICKRPGCTVRCWGGETSTPADEVTRTARIVAHDLFDGWWRANRIKRGQAYKRLAHFMGLPQKETHIGMFNLEQCRDVHAFVRTQLEAAEIFGGRTIVREFQ